MKKILLTALLLAAFSFADAQDVMKKEKNGTYVVNTTTLAKDVEGYNGTTPVEVYIKKNKIVKVVPLKSQEGPKYVAKVKKGMLPKYEGMNVKKGTAALWPYTYMTSARPSVHSTVTARFWPWLRKKRLWLRQGFSWQSQL